MSIIFWLSVRAFHRTKQVPIYSVFVLYFLVSDMSSKFVSPILFPEKSESL